MVDYAAAMSSTARIAALLAALVVGGCGSAGDGDQPASQATPEATAEATAEGTAAVAGEKDRVRDTTKSFFAAIVNGHGKRACTLLEASNRTAIPKLAAERGLRSGLSCGDAIDRLAKKRKLGSVTVGSVEVEGNTATVDVTAASGESAPVQLVKEGNQWKVYRF